MSKAGLFFSIWMAGLAAAIPARAEGQQSFSSLITGGFEVRSVLFVPLDIAKKVSPDAASDTVVVTLQGKTSVAVCYMALTNWIVMNKSSLDNPAICEVR